MGFGVGCGSNIMHDLVGMYLMSQNFSNPCVPNYAVRLISPFHPQDLGYHHRDPFTDSSFGATEPFPLLSAEACFALQSGIVLTDKWKDLLCLFSSDRFQNLVNRLIDVSTKNDHQDEIYVP